MKKLGLIVVILLGACSTLPSPIKTNVITASYQEIVIAVSDIMEHEGYKPKDFNNEKGTIETDWKTEDVHGVRTGRKAKLQFELSKVNGGYVVKVEALSIGKEEGLTVFFERQREPAEETRIAELINLKFASVK